MAPATYQGPHTAVLLADGTRCPRGETVEVSEQMEAELAARPDFDPPATPEPAAPPTPPERVSVVDARRRRHADDSDDSDDEARYFVAAAGVDVEDTPDDEQES